MCSLIRFITILHYSPFFLQQRQNVASKFHRQETITGLRKFNARRKLKVHVYMYIYSTHSLTPRYLCTPCLALSKNMCNAVYLHVSGEGGSAI